MIRNFLDRGTDRVHKLCVTIKKGLVVLNITDRPFSFMLAPALGGGPTLGIFLRSKLLLDWPYLEIFGLFQWEKIIFLLKNDF